MAKGRQARERSKQKKLDLRRRRKNKRNRILTPLVKQLTPKLAEQVDDAHGLIRGCKFSEAEQLLDRLSKRYPVIVEAQVFLYQTSDNHERCSRAARQLVKLTPH